MEGWAWSFPAGEQVFSDPLDSCSSSSVLPTQTEFEVYSACEYLEIQKLMEEPQDESHLPELLGKTNSLAVASSPTSDHGVTIRTCTYVLPEIQVWERRSPMPYTLLPEEEAFVTNVLGHERHGKEEDEEEERIEGEGSTCPLPCPRRRRSALTTAPRNDGGLTSSIVDLQDHIPNRGSGARGPRKRGTWKSGTWFHNHFLNAPCFGGLCSASKGKKRGLRENNKHWTPEEVKLLVNGVSELGVGHWTELKDQWFSDSDSGPVRTAVHLKDKWRNLVKSYVFKPTSKKKGRILHLDKELINKIKILAAEYPYPK